MKDLKKQCQKTLKTHKRLCGSVLAIWVIGMMLWITPMSRGTTEEAPLETQMTCQLSEDIAEAAETRAIYLDGVRDKVSGTVEKTTLTVEINALLTLRKTHIHWRDTFCRSDNDSS